MSRTYDDTAFTPAVEVHAHLQPGSQDDWILWARVAGEAEDSPLLTMLTSMAAKDIGFAQVSGVKAGPGSGLEPDPSR